MTLRDYWSLPAGAKDTIISQEVPMPAPKRPRRKCRCKFADAHECAVERRVPGWAGYGHVMCDCSCHSDCGGDW